jgi:hypothetical protein
MVEQLANSLLANTPKDYGRTTTVHIPKGAFRMNLIDAAIAEFEESTASRFDMDVIYRSEIQ